MQINRGIAGLVATGALAVACGGSSDTTVPLDTTDGGDASVLSPPADAQGTVDATTINDAGIIDATVQTDAASGLLCIPGASVACVGAGGCASNQICDIDGTGFFPCVCPGDGGSQVCAPGQSVACVGPGGCVTNQVCRNDGTGFGSCVCASDGGVAQLCVPGESIGCVGFGGCVSNQVCKNDGSGYDACACASDGGKTLACVPGQSIACGGPNGCSSFQVCKNDGSGYAACECPDAGVIDASVGWTPAELPGLSLWLDATFGVVIDPVHPGYVIRWRDKSGNGNDADALGGTGVCPSSTGFCGETIDPQAINGLDAITFPQAAGTGMTILDAPSLDFGTGDFAIVMVGAVSHIWNQFGNVDVTPGQLTVGSQTISVTPGARHGRVDITVVRGQSLYLSVNGAVATGPTNTSSLAGGVNIGSGVVNASNVDVAEVIAIKGTLSDSDLAKTVGYLKTKFNL